MRNYCIIIHSIQARKSEKKMISWGQSELIWAIPRLFRSANTQVFHILLYCSVASNGFSKCGELFNPIHWWVPLGLQFPHRITNDQIKMTCIKIDVAHSNRELTQKKPTATSTTEWCINFWNNIESKKKEQKKTRAQSINDPVSFKGNTKKERLVCTKKKKKRQKRATTYNRLDMLSILRYLLLGAQTSLLIRSQT